MENAPRTPVANKGEGVSVFAHSPKITLIPVIPKLEPPYSSGIKIPGHPNVVISFNISLSHKIKEHAFGLTLKRAGDEGGKASATASMFKLYGTEHNKKRHELMVAASGIDGVAWDGDEFDQDDKNLTRAWLRTKGNSIEGGTSEVQLNVISKRVLNLPSQ